ncbi:MAG: dihydropteroate synthase [Leptospiraceae bacterium]|nr:dihydropteroate synthase [Leptospiraceae bacterium]MCP5498073.1 dihydropteroate synthase [Leptospiraceae bacterium]
MKIFGILNVTEDSFSDGGKYFEFENSIQKGIELIHEGADVIDIGAQSSNINCKLISPELEWERIEKQIKYFQSQKIEISVDTYKPRVIQKCIKAKVDYINNINSFYTKESLDILQEYKNELPYLILMFSHNQGDKASQNSNLDRNSIVDTIFKFFDFKIQELLKIGIPEEKLIFDPGMGLFLGEDPYLSIKVLQEIKTFKSKLGKIMVSVSRKSFIGNLLGGVPPENREVGTLACELFLYSNQIEYIRTHNVKQLKDAIHITEILLSHF